MAKCRSCKKDFKKTYSSLQIVCSPACAVQYQIDNPKKKETFITKLKNDEWKQTAKEIKANLKTLSELEAETKLVFQRWIRKRDEEQKCISCQAVTASVWDGGHYFPAGMYSGLIFEEMNCHKQCGRCNRFYHGNLIEYRKGLVVRYGSLYVDALEDMANSGRNRKWSKQELIEIRNKYLARLRG